MNQKRMTEVMATLIVGVTVVTIGTSCGNVDNTSAGEKDTIAVATTTTTTATTTATASKDVTETTLDTSSIVSAVTELETSTSLAGTESIAVDSSEVTTSSMVEDEIAVYEIPKSYGRSITKPETHEAKKEVKVNNLEIETISVSCLKVTWDGYNSDTQYEVTCVPCEPDNSNAYFVFKEDACYITGLCEGKSYSIRVLPQVDEKTEQAVAITETATTETVEVIEEFDPIDGFTCCYAYEHAGGLTRDPSWSAIQGCFQDTITDTGIMRTEYGDYCVAMGTYYGYCGDRFLITLDNGTQFTVKICDSKGDVQYHPWGGSGKCVIEFIHADGALPSCAAFSGSYGGYVWNGLDLSAGIQSIKKINY